MQTASYLLTERLAKIPNIVPEPRLDIEIVQFNPLGPVLAVPHSGGHEERTDMRTRHSAVIMAVVTVVGSGCATGEEWGTWKSHPAHFASGQHLAFSVRNTEGRTARVARRDIALAGSEAWWGKAITVGQEQIIER